MRGVDGGSRTSEIQAIASDAGGTTVRVAGLDVGFKPLWRTPMPSDMTERAIAERAFYKLINADAEDYKPSFVTEIAALLTAAVEEERERVRKIIDVRVKFWAEQVRIQHDAQATDCHNEVRHLRAAIRARGES